MIRTLLPLRYSLFLFALVLAAAPAPLAADESGGVVPTAADGRPLNLGFETGTLDDWTAEGEAFAGQPIQGDTVAARRGDMRSNHAGEYWIGGYEKLQDAPTGTLTSVPFNVTHPFASFLMNGGQQVETRVELVRQDTGEVFYRVSGTQQENLRQVVVDLRAHLGKPIFIRLVDEHRGGWGHVNFDHFRFHEKAPARPTPAAVRLVEDEYPHGGLTAAEAARAMKLPEGFAVTVGAAEPDVKQPIAMALDDRGRVWIAEAYEYPQRAAEGAGRDRILIFEDTDGDGTLDNQKIFAEGLNLVSGLEVGFGGVWVGAAPYLLFIPDRDGDDVPDGKPEILLDGWGYQDTHETLNTFIWGPDGWLYGCHGVFTHSRVGRPGTPDQERAPINAGIWRYHPTRHEFEVFAHGTSNPWGVDFNDHGQAFATACVIPHLYHIIQGARYQRQAGPHFNPHTYGDIVTIADHLHYLGANPHGGNNKSDEAGGGHAHAGAMIYLGGAWPDSYRNQIFMNNIHGQRLNMDVLAPRGSGYVGRHGPDFLLTGDRASQILNLRYGPDGQAWMIDWYDMQACHRPEASLHDRSNGRIYKISYGDAKRHLVDLQALDDRELAELVLHQNDWYVRHARRLLQERAAAGEISAAARERLAEIATTHADDTRRLRAIWALHVTAGLDEKLTERLLADASPWVRGWTIQLILEHTRGAAPAPLLARFATMAREDESPVVRLYLASALQRLPLGARWAILDALVAHPEDADDHNLPLMYWYAAEPLAAEDPDRALAFGLAAGETIPLLREYMLRRIGSSDRGASLALLVRGLRRADGEELQLTFLRAIHSALAGRRRVEPPPEWQALVSEFTEAGHFANPRVYIKSMAIGLRFGNERAAETLLNAARTSSVAADLRREAIQGLVDAGEPATVLPLLKLIQDPEVGVAAIRALAGYDLDETAVELVASYGELNAEARRAALATLCSRPNHAVRLLEAIADKQIPATDLTADLARQLQFMKSPEVDRLLEDVWGQVRETSADKARLIAEYKALLAEPAPADPSLGRAIFARTCQTCHVLYGVGTQVGPDLTGSNRTDLDYLLSNIVDPSAVMAHEYRQSVLITDAGRIVTGIVKSEDARAVTVQTADGVVVVPKDEIDERVASDKSMMPDDQLKQFSEHEIRSLIAYLRGRSQVPLLATQENAATLFNGKDLTGWTGDSELWSVEHGAIVGRTQGLGHNEFLVSDMAARDFRLTLEVKLVDNAGNSGIQFRSTPHNGEVRGYQADIGAGWWGKLYEELGRALLWDKSGEAHVKPGEWNTYEIVARGSHIRTSINGELCVDLEDPAGARQGIFALQLHSGGPTEVRFRNLKLEVLDESAGTEKTAEAPHEHAEHETAGVEHRPAPGEAADGAALRRASRPLNVVFFLVDDLGYMDVGCNNPDTFYETPNIDRLAASGMRFTSGYAANPVCSPTRYSIMTGKYPTRVGATNFFSGTREGRFRPAPLNDRMPLEEVTLAEALKDHGYATLFAGKWHLGPTPEFWPEHQGFDINKGGVDRGGPYGGKRYFSPYGNPRLADGPDGEHLPDRLATETAKFIEAHRDQPFLAYLAFYSVHTPLMAPDDLVEKYRAKAERLGLPARGQFAGEEQILPTDEPRRVRTVQSHAVYAAMVESMDRAVGKVLDKLDELGLADSTAVVFMADNGGLSTSEGSPTSNLPLRAGKGWLYEGGIREPLLIRCPGVTKPGSTCDVPVISTDFYPTILDIAGLPPRPDQHLDGVSLAPLLRGGSSLDRDALYWHYPHYSNQGGMPGGAIRAGDWKLIERFEDGRVQLYNLAKDIGEQRELAGEHPDQVAALRDKLHAWYAEVDAKFLEAKPGGPEPWRP